MRGFTERQPKKRSLTSEGAKPTSQVPLAGSLGSIASLSSSSHGTFGSGSQGEVEPPIRRASTNDDLVSMEAEALGTAPPPHRDEWAHKQLMGMVNRSADGNRVMGEDEPHLFHSNLISGHPKSSSLLVGLEHTNSLGNSQPIPGVNPRSLSSSSSTSALPIGNLRRETKSTAFENRLRLQREKDQHMVRMIMEEEHKKARDREKLREAEERMKAKAAVERQERLQPYYEQIEKQPQQASPHSSSDDNFAYFRSMKKKIKDINVKPTLPSIGLDEKLKKLNTRVKGFLNTNPPSFAPIQKLRDKRNSKHMGKNMPIKLNIVDDFMKDLELQRMEESSDSRNDGLSSSVPRAEYDIHSSANSSPSELPAKQIKRSRRRIAELRIANKSTNELQLLVRALNQDLQANNDAILAAQKTCAKIRAEMEHSKTIFTVDIDSAATRTSRASSLGVQFITTVQDIRAQLDTTRSATSSCSDQIKQLEVHVQKVQRTKKPTDKLMRYLFWIPISLLLLYFVIKSPTAKMLVVVSVFVYILRTLREQNRSAAQQLSTFQEVVPPQYNQYEPDDLTSSSELQPPETPTSSSSSPASFNPDFSSSSSSSTSSSMRRNHSDVVLQSLLSEEEFAEVMQEPPPKLRTLTEEESVGISPKTRSKSSSHLAVGSTKTESHDPGKSSTISRSSNPLRGPIRTSATNKDSVAMNLALHNLSQMSLKIQQMQQGK